MPRNILRWKAAMLAVALFPLAVLAEDDPPAPQVTGNGGHMLRFSSTQVTVPQTAQERQAFEQSRDHDCASTDPGKVLAAAAAVLTQQGYASVEIDPEFHLIDARHDETLVSMRREIFRGVAKSRGLPLPAKPDHQSTEAFVAVEAEGHGVKVRTRFRVTVWDSKGDARTSIVSDPQVYRDFYAGIDKRLAGA
ncbi:MAG: hypothetical protein GAK28_04721 [Luteibacter sp.]|uniref:hypothetical protein n=1 Tax=Luteibacter sp. TaxID=1886636 RepID=UPI001385C59E|nr:hypothetical protein [Luteibacter sp.]KAF1003435.1 MAG: hypothetical protein GAK28_04721 [Luteibacter sp.]